MIKEKCLVIKKEILEASGVFDNFPLKNDVRCGLKKLNQGEIDRFVRLVKKNKTFKERFGIFGVENNSDWQQVICYSVFLKDKKFFVYQRALNDSRYPEKRLGGKISIGVGGHINAFRETLVESIYREMQEELIISKDEKEIRNIVSSFNCEPVALLKDETSEVGRMHLGLVNLIEVKNSDIDIKIRNDSENIFGEFMTLKELIFFIHDKSLVLENWTELLIDQCFRNCDL